MTYLEKFVAAFDKARQSENFINIKNVLKKIELEERIREEQDKSMWSPQTPKSEKTTARIVVPYQITDLYSFAAQAREAILINLLVNPNFESNETE